MAGLVGVRVTLIGAAAIGTVFTLGALFLPGMRAIEGVAAGATERNKSPLGEGPELLMPPAFGDVRG